MPHEQFDELAKQLATPNISRRRILGLLVGTALAGLFPFLRGSASSQAPLAPPPTSSKLFLPIVFGTPCPPGQVFCNGSCVDLQTDPNNCGSCGHACSTNHCTPTCNMGNCAISSCDAGYVDCDVSPDTGCECEGTSCCGGGCQTKHSNGVGQNYFDCNALGTPGNAATYNSTMANEAATAATTTPGSIISRSCTGGASVICKQGGSNCTCWAYTSSTAGYVYANGANSTCYCPTTFDASWD